MVTDDQLQEAIERAEKATNGPWRCDDASWSEINDVSVWADSPEAEDGEFIICQIGGPISECAPNMQALHDGEFVAHARADVPAFARELLRVRQLARKLLDAGTLDDGEREVVEAMLGGEG